MQAEYFKLLKKYRELKESKLAELERVFSDQAKRVSLARVIIIAFRGLARHIFVWSPVPATVAVNSPWLW